MKTFFNFLFIVVGLVSRVKSQNLVPNYSFEQIDSCPNAISEFRVVQDWFQPTYGTTDYYNECDTIKDGASITAGVPDNFFGHQWPHSGKAYAGIYLREGTNSYSGQGYREYLEVRLNQPLQANREYEVSFYYSQADSAKIGVKDLGIYFSRDSLIQDSWNFLPVEPQIKYDGNFITDTANWLQFSAPYTASGGENFITIGNFSDDAKTDFIFWGIPSYSFTYIAYVYIDDVSVVADSLGANRDSDAFYIYPNPTQSQLQFFYSARDALSKISLEVFNLIGQSILRTELHSGETVIENDVWPGGCYVYRAQNASIKQNGKFIIIR